MLRHCLEGKIQQGPEGDGSLMGVISIGTQPWFQLIKGVSLQHHLSPILCKLVYVHATACISAAFCAIALSAEHWMHAEDSHPYQSISAIEIKRKAPKGTADAYLLTTQDEE